MAAPAEIDERHYQRAATALWRRLADRVLLLSADGEGEVLTLGGSGPALWDLLDEMWTVPDLIEHLSATFSIEPAQVATDVTPVLADLVRRGLVIRGGT